MASGNGTDVVQELKNRKESRKVWDELLSGNGDEEEDGDEEQGLGSPLKRGPSAVSSVSSMSSAPSKYWAGRPGESIIEVGGASLRSLQHFVFGRSRSRLSFDGSSTNNRWLDRLLDLQVPIYIKTSQHLFRSLFVC